MSPSDDAFQASFANLYSAPGLQVPWYAVLGALCRRPFQGFFWGVWASGLQVPRSALLGALCRSSLSCFVPPCCGGMWPRAQHAPLL